MYRVGHRHMLKSTGLSAPSVTHALSHVPKHLAQVRTLTGDREFESLSLHGRVSNERGGALNVFLCGRSLQNLFAAFPIWHETRVRKKQPDLGIALIDLGASD